MPATTPSLAFFSPASASFQPTPYTPTSSQSSSSRPTRAQRPHDSLAIPPAGMDPQPSDPNVLFIHPPFATFPDSDIHPDGLTYSLMAENPEWFLDAQDFIAQGNDNPNAIPYPPHLEPPRGWCPAKKKDLKDRGVEGWPEGEEPRLRCTFCRRTYAGVNAKSMWRRHVFEKHKIAMANRRDGNPDRPRGRGSGKENRVPPSKVRDEAHDGVLSIVVVPQTTIDTASQKSRFRPAKATEESRLLLDRRSEDKEVMPAQREVENSVSSSDEESDNQQTPHNQVMTPPLTPHAEITPDPLYTLAGFSESTSEVPPIPLPIPLSVIPESPYNPLRTPSFRHSPPPLPSDQPWRYPSPSHPLHGTRDLSLALLTQPLPSPLSKDEQLTEVRPIATLTTMQSSPLSRISPSRPSVNAFETPARAVLTFKTTNKTFGKHNGSSPLTALSSYYLSSTLDGSSPRKSRASSNHRRNSSDLSETWFSENSFHTSTPTPLVASSNDPFSIYNSWTVEDNQVSPIHLPKTRSEPDSPVLRYGSLLSVEELGLDLLEPFSFPADDTTPKELDVDIKEILEYPARQEICVERKRSVELEEPDSTEITPPLKKRRISRDSLTSNTLAAT